MKMISARHANSCAARPYPARCPRPLAKKKKKKQHAAIWQVQQTEAMKMGTTIASTVCVCVLVCMYFVVTMTHVALRFNCICVCIIFLIHKQFIKTGNGN